MPDNDLSFVQRCALLTLMAEAREVPNAYLTNECKLKLEKGQRDGLMKAGLITVTRTRATGPLSLELTDAGWRRCFEEFGREVPARSGSAGPALYRIMAKLRIFLDRSELTIADVFAEDVDVLPAEPPASAGTAGGTDAETAIFQVYRQLAKGPGDWITLAALRAGLPQLDRREIDQTLIQLSTAQRIQLAPESNQKVLTNAEREASLRLGNQDKHMISIDA